MSKARGFRVHARVINSRHHLRLSPCWPPLDLTVRSIGNHLSTGPLSLHSPEVNHVANALSHSNTRLAQPKVAIRIPGSAGPTHPMVSMPSSMIAPRLLAPLRVGAATLRSARRGAAFADAALCATRFALTSASMGEVNFSPGVLLLLDRSAGGENKTGVTKSG